MGLIKVNPGNRKFTWANNHRNLISAKIDRIFITNDWEVAYPLIKVSCLPKSISDHTPLLLESGDNCTFGKKKN
jgi:endonuclease/exonuclease/phosphatase family metal-dependent hydrolase